jgi:hypothetical protein
MISSRSQGRILPEDSNAMRRAMHAATGCATLRRGMGPRDRRLRRLEQCPEPLGIARVLAITRRCPSIVPFKESVLIRCTVKEKDAPKWSVTQFLPQLSMRTYFEDRLSVRATSAMRLAP